MLSSDPHTAALRLAAIVEWSEDAIISKDLDGVVTSWNRAAERMFDYREREIVGRSLRLIIPPERQAEEDDVLARIRRGDTLAHYETVRRRQDGSDLDVSITVSPIRNARGEIIGASTIVREISARKASERALHDATLRQSDLQERLFSLVAASRSVLVSPRIEDVLAALLAIARQIVAADAYAVWRFDPASCVWQIGASHCFSR
jgi:PAS domain S-box-containing protein